MFEFTKDPLSKDTIANMAIELLIYHHKAKRYTGRIKETCSFRSLWSSDLKYKFENPEYF